MAEYCWLIARYQFITKLPFILFVLPLYQLAINWLISATGQTTLNSSNIKAVLLTPQGLVMGALSSVVVLIAATTDITAFILMEGTRLRTGSLPNARQALGAALSTLRFYAHPSTLLFLIYLVFIVPLSGVGFSVELFSRVTVPNFVSDVISKSATYTAVFFAVLGVLVIIGVYGTFLFHVIALEERSPWQAFRRSAAMMHRNLWPVLKVVAPTLCLIGIGILVVFVTAILIAIGIQFLELPTFWSRYWIFFCLFHVIVFLGAVSLYTPPLLLFSITRLYVRLQSGEPIATLADWTEQDIPQVLPPKAPAPATKIYRKLVLTMVATSLIVAAIGVPAIEELNVAADPPNIPVIAHRGGGNLGPENTVPALEAAIKAKIPWSEIDVQRTKDDGYIINHDRTFTRLSGSSATPQALTTTEATQLGVANQFDSSKPDGHINTLEEMLVAARGRIKLFIELKGVSADKQMVNDVVALVNRHQMRDQVVLIGLDADLIAYSEATFPEFETGFIYFFSVGDVTALPADYLIMEEAEVSAGRVAELHRAGKKVVVWTVNSVDELAEFNHLPLDGVITDIPTEIQAALTDATPKYDFEIILNWLFVQR